jgi:heat shock protein HtpX
VYERISSNKRKTVLLILGSFVFLGAFGYVLGLVFTTPQEAIVWMGVGLLIAAIQSFAALRYGDRMVLASTHAKPVSEEANPRLHNLVEGVAIAAGLPKPAIYVVPEAAPNAFATGRDPQHASLAVTQGLLDMMNRVELEGVVAHEMSHIEDRDMLVNTVIGTLVGAVVLVSEFMLRMAFWGGLGGRRSNSNNSGGGAATLVFLLVAVVLMVLAPLAAALIQAAVSRQREWLADANGALLTRYPPGLASALKKIQAAPSGMRVANGATNHFWLNEPTMLRKGGGGEGEATRMQRLFSTHPPIEERIKRLEEM